MKTLNPPRVATLFPMAVVSGRVLIAVSRGGISPHRGIRAAIGRCVWSNRRSGWEGLEGCEVNPGSSDEVSWDLTLGLGRAESREERSGRSVVIQLELERMVEKYKDSWSAHSGSVGHAESRREYIDDPSVKEGNWEAAIVL